MSKKVTKKHIEKYLFHHHRPFISIPYIKKKLKIGKVPEYDFQLMQAKISLYRFLTQKYGNIQKNKHRWIVALEKMLEKAEVMSMIQREVVESMLQDLKRK